MKIVILDEQEKKVLAHALTEEDAKFIIAGLSAAHGEYSKHEPDLHRFVYEIEN